jgi:hypothetical protein
VQAPPGFTGSVTPTSTTLAVGRAANFAITLTSQNGAAGAMNLQSVNLPAGTTCTFNPAAPTLPGNGSASDTLTVQVNAMPAAFAPQPSTLWRYARGRIVTLWLWFIALSLGSALGAKVRGRKRRLGAAVAVLAGMGLLFLAASSCGGGGGGGSAPSPSSPSPVVVNIAIQANGAEVSTMQTIGTLSITVN